MAVPIVPRATLVLGRRLPVRVEAATGMGELSLDSVSIPLSLAFNFIQHVRARRLRTQTVGGLHGATRVTGMSATANTNGGAAACPQARRMQDGLRERRRQRRLMGHKLPLLYILLPVRAHRQYQWRAAYAVLDSFSGITLR